MGRLLVGLITAAAGFVAGLLYAPEKGEKTRKKAQDLIEKSKAKLQELKEEFTKEKKEEPKLPR